MTEQPTLVFASAQYGYLRDRLIGGSRVAGELKRTDFPDGERMFRLLTNVAEHDVVLIGGTTDDVATLELYDLACGLVASGARRLTLVIPYFGYSTMERAVHAGDVVTAKTRARLFSSIPPASFGNRVLLLDLHSEGIPHYFEGEISTMHLYAKEIIKRVALELTSGEEFVLACTDAGRAKWVESLANHLGVGASFVFKRRLSGEVTEVRALDASVDGRNVVIYDDMIRTGGSLIKAAQAYRAAGAKRMWAIATHALLPGNSLQRLQDSGLFDRVVVTDSHPRARTLRSEFLDVRSIHEVFEPYLTVQLRRG